MSSEQLQIVQKGTKEFKDAYQQYLKLFFDSKADDYLERGKFDFGEHKGKCLGHTSKKVLDAKLPMPFGCPNLFIQPTFEKFGDKEKLSGVIWFCDINGCICVCCREDFTGEKERYPDYCPNPLDMMPCAGDCDSCVDKLSCPDSPESAEMDEEELEGEW